ncbi:NeuD/PglB/VioB family sugar acetyltransferase [Falsirhodobacter algicola]|uniref:Acetyltransferase n=1 Tax=Falsirhodobacter algicola TaxID=2692330 RepID=A0A8J8MRR9_9RHOB|nr:NeuD/PglB/VioB family sugar acetyltransferase [Falsirhodobacter algicola]QUS35108.1 acetyltransferase [Falsirhodobacter algicola]
MPIRERLLLLGFSGNALEIFEHLEERFDLEAILDDNPALEGQVFEGVPILPMARLADFPAARVLMTIGSRRSVGQRAGILARLGLTPERFVTVVHPKAHVSRFARLGHGVVIYPGAVVTSNAVIGNHVMILPQSVVHHDVTVGDHSLIGASVTVAGNCRIGQACYIGSASSLREGTEIGDGAVIGMAANVLRTVAAGTVVAGNPARVLPGRE